MINSLKLREVFSKAADLYESKAILQREIAEGLFKKINHNPKSFQKILDIGMGTGFLTQRLKETFGHSDIYGLDFAYGMVSYARKRSRGINFLQADAEALPFKSESFDLVISNLVYQWVGDLEAALSDVYRVLKSQGRFYFTCFGKETLRELRAALNYAEPLCSKESSIPHRELIMKILKKKNFKHIEIIYKPHKLNFDNLFDLVGWLKNIGANYTGKTHFLGREKWEKANNFYLKHYRDNGKVFSTFEVIWAETLK